MEKRALLPYAVLAEAFCYPAPGLLETLKEGLADLPAAAYRSAYARFLQKINRLALSEWEELYTRTLDLNPPAAPYIGFQIWGESYQRGAFLSTLNRALLETGVDLEGELPDHLIPVLRYLGRAPAPLPELAEALGPALQRMLSALRKADPANPYVDLYEAVQELCKGSNEEAA